MLGEFRRVVLPIYDVTDDAHPVSPVMSATT